eukprot:c23285_g5_i1 orf=134-1933(+)
MVLILGFLLLQLIGPLSIGPLPIEPLPIGPEGSPHINASTNDIPNSIQSSSNNISSSNSSNNNNSNNNIVPDKAVPAPGGSIYGGKLGPLMSNAPPEDPLSDSFHPSIAVIIGVLSSMFSITFLILLYAKHCKRPPVSIYGGADHDVINPAPLAHLGPAGLLFTDRDSGLDRAVVEGLPMFSFSALKGMKEGLECAVCLSRYDNPEVLRLLPKCKHAFHMECVDKWLNSHSTCPLCRVRVDAQDTLVIEDYLSGLKPGSEPPSFRRQSARISLSELADHYLDRAFEFYVQREAESADILAGGCCQYGSGRSSWRKDGSSERKLGSWRSSANFSGPFGASDRKELGSVRVAPLQVTNGELYGSQRKVSDVAGAAPLTLAAAASSVPLNLVGAGGGDDHFLYDEQLARRLCHRIIVSDVMLQHRWSDFLPSDVPFFDTNMVQLRERSVPVSGELAMKAAGNDQESIKEVELEMGLQKTGGDRSGRMSSARVADGEVTAALQVQAQAQIGVAEKQKKQAANQRGKVGASRLRCMSELSGLQRVQQVKAGKELLQATTGADDDHEVPADETARRWFATARRTLKWLIGSGPARSDLSTPNDHS